MGPLPIRLASTAVMNHDIHFHHLFVLELHEEESGDRVRWMSNIER